MRTLTLALLVAACSAPAPRPDELGEVTVTGELTALDVEPMTRDGNALLELRTDGGTARVEVPSGEARCPAEGLELVLGLALGERVTVTGERARPGGPVIPCAAGHALRRAEPAVTVSGEVVSVDLGPMAADGNAVLVLRTAAGERRVEIPARTNLCRADGLDIALEARPGERLTVTGREVGGAVVPCADPGHGVRRG